MGPDGLFEGSTTARDFECGRAEAEADRCHILETIPIRITSVTGSIGLRTGFAGRLTLVTPAFASASTETTVIKMRKSNLSPLQPHQRAISLACLVNLISAATLIRRKKGISFLSWE